jgi:hypothetical protein
MKDNHATNNKLGLPLATPSHQTILPIFCGGNGNLQGFFTIASTTFNGSETSFTLADGAVPIQSVTLPKKVSDGSNYGVQQYMAVVYPDDQVSKRPWVGHSAWVDTNDTGYAISYSMPSQGWYTRYNRGTLITNLRVNMAALSMTPPSSTPPSATNATQRWVASMNRLSSELECGFFDFNWVSLFKASSPSIDPLSITIVSNPAGGVFKSTLVPYQVVAGQGGVQFNTVRIIRLLDAAAGTYVFNYQVTDTKGNTTPCTLTLTVV